VIDGYEYPDKINTYNSLELNPEIKEIKKEVIESSNTILITKKIVGAKLQRN
jgi:DUF2075 family protein